MPLHDITLTKVYHEFVYTEQGDTFYAAYLAIRQP